MYILVRATNAYKGLQMCTVIAFRHTHTHTSRARTGVSPKRYRRGPRSQEAGEEGDYTYRYTVTTRMTPAVRRAAMRPIFMFNFYL